MDPQITDFLSSYHRVAHSRLKVIDLYRSFLGSGVDRSKWPRWRFVRELAAEFPVGTDSHGTLSVGGLSLEPSGRWVSRGDRLVLDI